MPVASSRSSTFSKPQKRPFVVLIKALTTWFQTQGRHDLPWRQNPSPYRVLVSEFMLQQTQVDRVIPFYCSWLKRFPDFQTLAAASEEEVLQAWKGLGYYRRARSLKKLADLLMSQSCQQGTLPREIEELKGLPGIGKYTAGALCAFAYNLPEPALDTNIRRLLLRVFKAQEEQAAADILLQLLQISEPRTFTSALMDLGAMVCKAKDPDCKRCPIKNFCWAYQENKVHESITVSRKARPRIKPLYALGVLREGKKPLLTPYGGILVTKLGHQKPREALQNLARQRFGVEIAVRPAYAYGLRQGKVTSFHRCTLLYGRTERFMPADQKRLSKLKTHDRAALKLLNLL